MSDTAANAGADAAWAQALAGHATPAAEDIILVFLFILFYQMFVYSFLV
jgi:hypothetical protein